MNRSTSPPRAVLAFRVGIVGHRPNRLPKDKGSLDLLRQMVRSILEDVRAELSDYARSSPTMPYSTQPFILRAVSPLAEGADRIFADEAIALGYELLCPMPFGQEEFEKDFVSPDSLEPNSQERFHDLLKRARQGSGITTFELDGDRSAAPKAYALAGRVVLNQSDLLIAVWDGHKAAGDGSTAGTTREALAFQSPVLWIDALAPNAWQLLRHPDDLKNLEGSERCVPQGNYPADPAAARKLLSDTVRQVVREEIAPPAPPSPPHGGKASHRAKTNRSPESDYFRERKLWFNFAVVWKLFRDAVGSTNFRLPRIFVSDFEAQVRDEWPVRDDFSETPAHKAAGAAPLSELDDWVNKRLRAHFAWPDKRSDLYADAYRSGYVLTYLLSALAVFVALLPRTAGLEGDALTACVAIEFVMLLIILLLFVIGRGRR
jgi:hypothetical protein